MLINFSKYQGTGNDFIMLDNIDGRYDNLSPGQIAKLCDRRFGVGADGLIMLENAEGFDYRMRYFNADGNESSLCGNGSRCATKFAFDQKISGATQKFIASDGEHQSDINSAVVCFKLNDVHSVQRHGEDYYLNTGSPHFVRFVENAEQVDVFSEGREIRNSRTFSPGGTNVNFVQKTGENKLIVRTFERGVEDETYSCGTGVTAAALVSAGVPGKHDIAVSTKGGDLTVKFYKMDDQSFDDIWLCGPAVFVFNGEISI